MKLASFEVKTEAGPVRRIGVAEGDKINDITTTYATALESDGVATPVDIANAVTPPDMMSFLQRGDNAMQAAEKSISFAASTHREYGPDGSRLQYNIDAVSLLSPLPRPDTIRDFITFEEHIAHFRDDIPEEWYELPVFYKGNPNSIVHPGDEVNWPEYTERFDYELEVAAVIGKKGRDISADQATEYIAGFTIFNDFSARDIQSKERNVGLGPAKGKDFANGFGPFLVTADDIDPSDARMVARVNDELWSEGNLGDMYHSFGEMVEYASWNETIYPGEVLGTGTVGGGCGPEIGRWLQPGDTIELEVEGLGRLRHQVGYPAE